MPVRLDPVVSFAYFYPDGVEVVEHVTRYEAIATILWDTPRRVTVRGLAGRMTRAHRDELQAALAELGIEIADGERHGQEVRWSIATGGHVTSGGTG